MDLFEFMEQKKKEKEAPLAMRMRPRTLEEMEGQQHILGKGKMLYRAIVADRLGSVLFYGPPGTGKTSLAKVISNTMSAEFLQLNATSSGKKEMESAIRIAKDNLGIYGKKTILFIDEIHRFHKGQQDFLLPYAEDGTVILIGATTENPYFEVNAALLSRFTVFQLRPLEKKDIESLLKRAVQDDKRGLGDISSVVDEEVYEFFSDCSGGDARVALNALELAFLTTEPSEDGAVHITLPVAAECIQRKMLRYDKDGDNHYDTISAFIKSMRGSDPDAAVYYLARMLEAGEDIRFIARRIMICAAEDVGNADPQALMLAVAASQAVERLGMPEARIVLSQAAIYVAGAPKSNSAICAIDEALKLVRTKKNGSIPPYLRDSHYPGAAELGHGLGYKYAHDFENHYVQQQYLPDEWKDQTFYHPDGMGYEKEIEQYLRKIGANRN